MSAKLESVRTFCASAAACVALASCGDPIATGPDVGASYTLTPVLDTTYNGPGYDIGATHYECITDLSEDEDEDGLNDACENTLAKVFQPSLRLFADEDPGREPVYAVMRTGSTVVRIAYLLAYHRDLGTQGGPNWAYWFGHSGDAEFIVIHVVEEDGAWLLQSAYLSAHKGVHLWPYQVDRSGWVDYSDLSYVDNYRGRPKIWTSWGKHANYASMDDCEAHPFDVCSGTYGYWDDALVYQGLERNIGHYTGQLMDCIASKTPDYYEAQECFWSTPPTTFGGWYATEWGKFKPKAYRSTLLEFGFGGTSAPYPEVWIQGDLQVRSNSNCFWNAMPSGGTYPYTYEWYRGSTLVGTENGWGDDTGEDDFFLTVIVTDTYGYSADASIAVEVDPSFPACTER